MKKEKAFFNKSKTNVGDEWRVDGTQISVKNTLIEGNRLISEPLDIARPSSCHCYGFVMAGERCIRPGVF
jgi:hypothetical protein